MGAEFGEGAVNCEADVAIVGYGPVGATLANRAGNRSISTSRRRRSWKRGAKTM